MAYFQDQIGGNHCFGCGPQNEYGLQIKSKWQTEANAICEFIPSPHHSAGPVQYLNGGIIATIIDCHCICTAVAGAYRQEGRAVGKGEKIWYVTGGMEIQYKKPILINKPVTLIAELKEVAEKKTKLECSVFSGGELSATASVLAIRVPLAWLN